MYSSISPSNIVLGSRILAFLEPNLIKLFFHHHQTPHHPLTQRLDLAEAFLDGEVRLGFGVGGAVGGGVVAGAVQADQLVIEKETVFASL